MGKTSKSAWTRAESSVGRIFGALRRPLSGSANRADQDGDDVIHPRLFVEVKLRSYWAVWSLWKKTNLQAAKAKKTPVLGLREKGRHGALIVVHEDDMESVVIEWLSAREPMALLQIESAVRVNRGYDE